LSESTYTIEPLGQHDRSGFSSGSEALDRYFRTQVSQDIRRRVTSCYVAISKDSDHIAGFYTLSAAQVPVTQLPDSIKKKLPRYPSVRAVRIGRLAIDTRFHGKEFGGTLLINAIFRTLRSDIAAFAVVVDAKDDNATAFYRHYGFLDLDIKKRQMFVQISKFAKAFALSED